MYAGSNPPNLYITCAGQSYDKTLFPELFAAIGITHGSESATKFNIPDMRGMFVRGAGTNALTGLTEILGQTQKIKY